MLEHPPHSLDIFLGKTLGVATVALIQGLLVFFVTFLAGYWPANWALLPIGFLFLVAISILFGALGNVIAARLDDMQSFPLIINFVIQPLFYLSGAIFPLVNLPAVLNVVTKINPLSYGVDGMRFAMSQNGIFSPWLSMAVLVGCIVVAVAIGVYQFKRIEL